MRATPSIWRCLYAFEQLLERFGARSSAPRATKAQNVSVSSGFMAISPCQELEYLFSEAKSPRNKGETERGDVGKRLIRVLDEQRRRPVKSRSHDALRGKSASCWRACPHLIRSKKPFETLASKLEMHRNAQFPHEASRKSMVLHWFCNACLDFQSLGACKEARHPVRRVELDRRDQRQEVGGLITALGESWSSGSAKMRRTGPEIDLRSHLRRDF